MESAYHTYYFENISWFMGQIGYKIINSKLNKIKLSFETIDSDTAEDHFKALFL